MKVMIIGSGGREHALAWKIRQSPLVKDILCVPGNGGMEEIGKCLKIDINTCNYNEIAVLAKDFGIDLTIVGPEIPLAKGIVDVFQKKGLRIFGPTKEGAKIESSKSFAKHLMWKNNIPTAPFKIFRRPDLALGYIMEKGFPIVIKADGLAAGKGVFPCNNISQAENAIQQIMVDRKFGEAGEKVVVEEFLEGEEASFIAFTDGKTVLPLASSQDHKPIEENDQGPNTGGMGAYSPAPVVTPNVYEKIMRTIMVPTVKTLYKRGILYKGVLYAGLMIKDGKPCVLEFNCRFGDPEIQPILMRMKNDIIPVIQAAIDGKLTRMKLSWLPDSAVCVVMASKGYPGHYEKGKEILGLEKLSGLSNVAVFHAGTKRENGKLITNGGRVLGTTALGKDLKTAINDTYSAVNQIYFENLHFRRDIGSKGLQRLNL